MLDSDVDLAEFNNPKHNMIVNPSFVQYNLGFEIMAPIGGLQFLHEQW